MPKSSKHTATKHAGGRPSGYRPAFVPQVRKLCAAFGATHHEIAAFLDVSPRTLTTWLQKYPELAEATKLGKAVADERVVQSLYQRAIGYSHEAVKIFMPAGADKPVYAPFLERFPPDTAACIWWTKNRMPDQWKERRNGDDEDDTAAPASVSVKVVDGRRKGA